MKAPSFKWIVTPFVAAFLAVVLLAASAWTAPRFDESGYGVQTDSVTP